MDAWDDHMLARFKEEGYLQKFPDQSSTKTDFENAEIWIKDVTLKTLDFFKSKPHLKFIDVCTDFIIIIIIIIIIILLLLLISSSSLLLLLLLLSLSLLSLLLLPLLYHHYYYITIIITIIYSIGLYRKY